MVSNRVRRFLFISAVLALTVLLPGARAQDARVPLQDALGPTAPRDFSDDVPAHLAFVEGEVTLERDGKLEPAERNLALLSGDRLRTREGRVEILYADGSTVAVDRGTSIDLLSDSLVRLLDGRLRVAIPRTTETLDYRIDSPAGSVEIRAAGEYRVETGVDRDGEADVDLTVIRGSAELFNDNGRTLVRAGRHAVTSAKTEPSLPYTVNSAAWDDFDRWVDDRRTSRLGSESTTNLPDEVRYYGNELDAYGTWGTEASYGSVWYPRVNADWRPYSQGRWSYTGYYGWVWVGIDSWSWPTHHYGRWGFSANRWYWIPDRHWGPAWVSWALAPGYVGWCPQGFNGQPVVGFRSALGYYADPWRAWTVLPATRFTHNVWVTEHVVARNAITPAVRNEFVERPVAPMPAGVAVPRRAIAPLHAPTTPRDVAAPRGHANDVGPFDAARSGRTGSATPTQGPLNYTVPRAPTGADSRGKQTTPATSTNPTPAQPSRVARPVVDPVEVPRVSSPRVEAPRAVPDRPAPTRAVPRQSDPPPPTRYEPSPSIRRAPEPDRTAPPAVEPSRDRGRSVDRTAPPPPVQAAPPSNSYPVRRSEPAPPPSAPPTPPPSRSHANDQPAQPPAAQPKPPASQPPATPPPAPSRSGRGGGGGDQSQGQVVPRRGGGGGGR